MHFNTHCPDCQKELPVIQTIFDTFHSQLKLVCISREEPEIYIKKYWKDHHYTLPYSAQIDSHIYHLFAKSVVPRVYVSDENLIIQAIFTDDPIATEEELTAVIQKILKE